MKTFKKALSLILSAAILCMALICVPCVYADGVKLGDADGDGDVTMTDVVAVQRYIAKLIEFKPEQLAAADVDGNGFVNMEDVVAMQKYIAKLITEFSNNTSDSDITDTDSSVQPVSDTDSSNKDTSTDTSTSVDTNTDSSAVSDSDTTDTSLDKTLDIAGVLALGEGKSFKARGQVSYMFGTTSVIVESVDENGKVSGLLIYDKPGIDQGKYSLNDIIEFTGKTELYEGMIEVKSPEVTVISSNNTPIAPVVTTVSELKNNLTTVVMLKNVTLGAYGDNTTAQDATGTAKMYKPVAYPDSVHEGSVVNLVCVPVLHAGEVEIRVTYKDNYMPLGNDTDTSTSTDTHTDTTTDTHTDTTTDTSPETDISLDQRAKIKVQTSSGVVEATKVYKLSELSAGKKVVIKCGNYVMTSTLTYGFLTTYMLEENKDVTLERNCLFEYIDSSGTNYLMDDIYCKYLGVKGSNSTEADYYEFSGYGYDELSEITISGKNGVFNISNRRSERHLALITNTYSPNFQWIKNGENTGDSNIEIFMVF
ncbi:MAG: hypothetical protein K6F76_04045 [Clostridiales bacterium]|nr:hypothetical protein [Clostridiales bacterium]